MKLRKVFERFFSDPQPPEKADPYAPVSSPSARQRYPQGTKPTDMLSDLLSLAQNGRLVIPEGIPEIPDGLFDAFAHPRREALLRLVSITVPGTVKSIGVRAFAECCNLEELILQEGIRRVGSNALTGCDKLKTLQLPASLSEIDGRAFIHCGITRPLFSGDGKRLIHYPPDREDEEYAVPEGTETILWGAFWEAKHLTKVTLPQSLKRICQNAFIGCGFEQIAVPESTVIEDEAFASFDPLVRVIHKSNLDPLEERMEHLRINGVPFLSVRRMKPPKHPYWKEADFRLLCQECARGDGRAMEKMGSYFLEKAAREEEKEFYRDAAHFWLIRACRFANKSARQYLLDWCQAHPDRRMTSPGLNEELWGTADGELLNALGFPFFKAGREYHLQGLDQDGVVEVFSWAGDEGPDEDGYGREEFYDWWYLNEFLELPGGVGCIQRYSHHDKRRNEKKFRALHDQAAASKKA